MEKSSLDWSERLREIGISDGESEVSVMIYANAVFYPGTFWGGKFPPKSQKFPPKKNSNRILI